MGRPSLKELDKLHPDLIEKYRQTGKSDAIPLYLQRYILHLDKAAEINNHCKSINRAAKLLQDAFPDDDLSFRNAKYRIEDAINYFHLNSSVKQAAWCHYYADYFEDLAALARKADRLDVAKQCIECASDYRMKAAEQSINANELRPHTYVIDPSVPASLLGLTDDVDMKTLWAQKEALLEETREFIEHLDIRDSQKSSVFKEAAQNLNISDAEYEDED